MSEWDFAKVKYTAPHNVPCLIEAADAAIAELEAELSIEQKENRRLRERLHGARIAERAAEKECATLLEVCGSCTLLRHDVQ